MGEDTDIEPNPEQAVAMRLRDALATVIGSLNFFKISASMAPEFSTAIAVLRYCEKVVEKSLLKEGEAGDSK